MHKCLMLGKNCARMQKCQRYFYAAESYIDKSYAHLDQVLLALEPNVTEIVSFSFRDAVDNTSYS